MNVLSPIRLFSTCLVFSTILFLSCSQLQSDDAVPVQWEYQILTVSKLYSLAGDAGQLDVKASPDSQLPAMLNVQGSQGWELCAVLSDGSERYIFKRVKTKD